MSSFSCDESLFTHLFLFAFVTFNVVAVVTVVVVVDLLVSANVTMQSNEVLGNGTRICNWMLLSLNWMVH